MRRDRARIEDILEAAEAVDNFVGNMTFEDFQANEMAISAVMAKLVIIGEAANHISSQLRSEYPDVAWTKAIGLRNVLVHEYYEADLGIIWGTIKKNLKSVVDGIRKIKTE